MEGMIHGEKIIPLKVMGYEYEVRCHAHECDRLQQAAALVQQRIQDELQAYNFLNKEKAAIMVAMNAIYTQLWAKQAMQEHDQHAQRLMDKIDSVDMLDATLLPSLVSTDTTNSTDKGLEC